jgi:hypothetical protein
MGDKLAPGDQLAIADVIMRYASGIDKHDWGLFRTCFTKDCVLDYGEIGSWHGVDDFTAYNERAHRGFGATLHRITNIVIDGGASQARARSYVDAVLYSPEGELRAQARGFYDDRLTTAEGAWKIDHRHFTTVDIVAN